MVYTSLLSGLLIVIAIALIIKENPLQLKKTFLPLYFVMLLMTFLGYLYSIFYPKILILSILGFLWVYIAFAFVLIHSSLSLGKKKTAIFFVITFIFGLISELVGVKFGWIFGNYYYNLVLTPFNLFGLVPLVTPISWAIIIYMSYTITNIILFGFGSKKPNIEWNRPVYTILLIVLLSCIDGLIATNMDMMIDPVSVSRTGWFWIGGGPYFGIPISNFIGWFLVAFSATIIFRSYESFKKKYESSHSSIFVSSSMICLFLMFFVIYALQAFVSGNPVYILIGTTTMGPFILITILVTLITFLKGDKHEY